MVWRCSCRVVWLLLTVRGRGRAESSWSDVLGMVVLLPRVGTAWLDGNVGSGWMQGAAAALVSVPDALFGHVPVQRFLQSNELPLQFDVDKDVLQLCIPRWWALLVQQDKTKRPKAQKQEKTRRIRTTDVSRG